MAEIKEVLGRKLQAIEADASLTPDQKEEQLRALKLEHEKLFSSVFTPEQLEQAKRVHAVKVSNIPALTPEQEQQMRELKEHFGEQVSRLEQDASLSPQGTKEQMEAIHQEIEQRMHQLLTPDQLREMHQEQTIHEGGPYS